MEDFAFGYPDPVQSTGIETNELDSDYDINRNQPNQIRIFNDTRNDGDSLLFLTLKPNNAGQFGSGFAQDLYVFRENVDLNGNSLNEIAENYRGRVNTTYYAPIASSPASSLKSAVVLIQDNDSEYNERTNPTGTLWRERLSEGNDNRSFLSDSFNYTIFAGAGNDVVRTGRGNDIIFGEAGDDQLYGGDGKNYLFGGQGQDRLFGGDSVDWLDGGTGDDVLAGGNGNDTYVVDSQGDVIQDTPGTGIETVKASISWNLQSGLDHLFLTGAALNGGGNNLNNFIRGNNLSNVLDGGDGNDILFGDEPQAFVVDSKWVLLSSEEVFRPYVNSAESYQRLVGRSGGNPGIGGDDQIFGGNGDDKLFGWGGNDKLFGDNGNDLLFGGSGNDMLIGGLGDDLLDGGLGEDRLEGGFGNDIYVIDNNKDQIIDTPRTGIETVESLITFDLTYYSMSERAFGVTGLDNLTLKDIHLYGASETNNLDAFGNDLPNTILGNVGNNTIDGRGGDDTIDGKSGNDTIIISDGNDILIGGAGGDIFRFNGRTSGKSTIQDFNSSEDVIEVSGSAFGNPRLEQFSLSGNDLLLNGQVLVAIQSSSPFNINQNIRFI